MSGRAALAMAAVIAGGCGSAPQPLEPNPPIYPDGPYGVAEGDTMDNLGFDGFFVEVPPAPAADQEFEVGVALERLRSSGLRYALVNASTQWCVPCRDEAAIFARDSAGWSQRGGVVFSVLTEDRNLAPASRSTLERWIAEFDVNYTMVHDPRGEIDRVLAPPAYPVNWIVELETMRILRATTGLDPELLATWEAILDAS